MGLGLGLELAHLGRVLLHVRVGRAALEAALVELLEPRRLAPVVARLVRVRVRVRLRLRLRVRVRVRVRV